MENLDTDIDKYSIDDLLTILNLNEPTEYQVQDATNTIIASMRSEGNVEMADFFEEVKQKLLEEFKTTVNDFGDNEQDDEETTIGNWWQNEYPAQNNEVQADKVTNRKQRVQFFDNEHFQMNREQLGVNQDYSVPVAQGTMNPKLKNTITRLVSIDSQYRDNVLAVEGGQPSYSSPAFNSSFTVNLSESLKNVISLKLYSIELPTTWYTFDDVLGNTCFKIKADGIDGCIPPEPEPEPELASASEPEPEPDTINCPTLSDCYCINPGNYDILSLTEEIVRVASPDISLNFKIEPSTNIISIRQDPKGNIIYPEASFIYYDCNGLGCVYPCIGSSYINQNLGWYLGFRRQPDESGVISIPLSMTEWVAADVPANTYGPKYCMLVLDDFNKNRLNKGIVGISDTSTKLDLPSYYSPSDISGCSKNDNCSNRVDTPIVWVSDDKPKTLTNSQLYTIQETLNNRIQPTGRITAPTTSDVLARIPLKNVTALRPEPLIETGSQLQTNEREYFGPVDIERIKVSLVDDKGYPLNLHDNDWSFSLIVEQLYQY